MVKFYSLNSEQRALLSYAKSLIAFRRAHPALWPGRAVLVLTAN